MKACGRIVVGCLFFIVPFAFGQVWLQQITGASVNIASIAADSQGNCFLSGASFGNSNEMANFGPTRLSLGPFFARYSRNGEFLYAQRTEAVRSLASVGNKLMAVDGAGVFEIRDNGRVISKIDLESPERSLTKISACDNSTFVIAGTFRDHVTIGKKTLQSSGANSQSALVARLTTAGKPIWLAEVPTDFIYDVAGSRSGGAYALTQESIVQDDVLTRNVFVVRAFGSDGQALWTNEVPGNYRGSAYAIATDSAGNCLVTGNFYGEIATPDGGTIEGRHWIFVYSFRPDGQPDFAWTFHAGSWDYQFGMDITADRAGSWYVGTSYFPTVQSDVNGIIAKNGDVYNGLRFGTGGYAALHAITIGRDNGIYVAGEYEGPASFGSTVLTNNGIFVAKFKLP